MGWSPSTARKRAQFRHMGAKRSGITEKKGAHWTSSPMSPRLLPPPLIGIDPFVLRWSDPVSAQFAGFGGGGSRGRWERVS